MELQLFEEMRKKGGHVAPNVVTFNAMIDMYSKSGMKDNAYRMYEMMIRGHVQPDGATTHMMAAAFGGSGLEIPAPIPTLPKPTTTSSTSPSPSPSPSPSRSRSKPVGIRIGKQKVLMYEDESFEYVGSTNDKNDTTTTTTTTTEATASTTSTTSSPLTAPPTQTQQVHQPHEIQSPNYSQAPTTESQLLEERGYTGLLRYPGMLRIIDLHGYSAAAGQLALLHRFEAIREVYNTNWANFQREGRLFSEEMDIHQITVAQAEELVEMNGLSIVTGIGKHSKYTDIAPLREAVLELLEREGVNSNVVTNNPGRLFVPAIQIVELIERKKREQTRSDMMRAVGVRYLAVGAGITSLIVLPKLLASLSMY
eukprot:GFYU01000747.1.p1 GENE.GFYU01000747.1~~GFYU01000747.1.p1  ORF type:complete len:367 (+),score=86.23 GFYU01000747.1:292-1392(+)